MVDTKGMAFGCICVCAVRYACGRQTYMPSIVKRFVHDNLKEIETSSLKVMSKDLAEMPGYGDRKIDEPGWLRLAGEIREEAFLGGFVALYINLFVRPFLKLMDAT